MIPAFKLAKTVHALDCAATAISPKNEYKPKREVPIRKTKIKTGRGMVAR
jgi:hypothetical protein